MNWNDRLNTNILNITTGDGRSWQPLWVDAKKNINYNTEGFDFVGKEGTFVQREQKSGTQYPLIFYFQGEDCVDEGILFEISARDKRPWKVKHPFYDDILCQPLSMEIDNSVFNVT
jgi:hypothetical protein